jgi:hypothetical protein
MGLTTGNSTAKIMGIIFRAINKLVIRFAVVRLKVEGIVD